jgi:glycosyltransferase involved in cell wall biosynthesis
MHAVENDQSGINRHSMRILQVNTSDSGGGAEDSAWQLFTEYRKLGHSSRLAVGYKRTQDKDVFLIPNQHASPLPARPLWLAESLLHAQLGRLRGTNRLSAWLRRLASPHAIAQIERGIENFNFPGTWRLLDMLPQQPDILHCHNLHGEYFDLSALPYLSAQVPTILYLHDAWLLSGHCAHSMQCERWRTGCGECPDLTIYPAVKQDATAYNWQRKHMVYAQSRLYITAPSAWLLNKAQDSMLNNGLMYRVIPNGIDVNMFSPGSQTDARKQLELPSDAFIILFTAHNMFKDLGTMKDALRKVTTTQRPLLFICLGKSAPTEQLGSGVIEYKGIVRDRQKVADYYRASDLYIHAAKDEAFGKTVTEAMATSLPVVASATGGIAEQIIHEETGFLSAPNNADEMAQYIQQLIDDTSLRQRLGVKGRERAEALYSLSAQVNAFLSWYQEIREDWVSRLAKNTLSS